MDGREKISIIGAEEERYTGLDTYRIGGQAERADSGEEKGVIAEEMRIHPTPHTPNMDSVAYRKWAKGGRCEQGLWGVGKKYGT